MVVLSARRPSATFTGRPRLRDGRRPSFSPVGRYGRTPLVAARLKVSIVYCVFSILIQPPSTPSISKFHDGCPRCGVCAAFLEYFTFRGFFLHYLGLFLAAPTFQGWPGGLFLADLLNFGKNNNSFCTCTGGEHGSLGDATSRRLHYVTPRPLPPPACGGRASPMVRITSHAAATPGPWAHE